jgi:hypothetical protein
MAKYEVIKDAGAQFPVGFEFETENLHPSMIQHVRQVGRSSKAEEPEPEKDPEQEKPTKPTKPVKSPDKPTPQVDPDDDNT